MKKIIAILACFSAIHFSTQGQSNFVKENYTKMDTTITMRDGIKLYTVIYIPKDASQSYPFLMERTPYSAGPYGNDRYPREVGPNSSLMKEKYIFVEQDVRGRYMSEGINLEVTPYIANKKTPKDVDESKKYKEQQRPGWARRYLLPWLLRHRLFTRCTPGHQGSEPPGAGYR
jgi:hypothetical protein